MIILDTELKAWQTVTSFHLLANLLALLPKLENTVVNHLECFCAWIDVGSVMLLLARWCNFSLHVKQWSNIMFSHQPHDNSDYCWQWWPGSSRHAFQLHKKQTTQNRKLKTGEFTFLQGFVLGRNRRNLLFTPTSDNSPSSFCLQIFDIQPSLNPERLVCYWSEWHAPLHAKLAVNRQAP